MRVNIDPPQKNTIIMQPVGRRVALPKGKTLLEATQLAGVDITSVCGGIGTCQSCKIRLISGTLSPPTPIELELFSLTELKNGYRLACQVCPYDDTKIEIPPESLTTLQRLQLESQDEFQASEPQVKTYQVELDRPSITDLRSDANRLLDTLASKFNQTSLSIDYSVLRSISSILRDSHWNVRCALYNNEVIAIFPASDKTHLIGLAIDIGTTKLAAYLVDLENGHTLAQTGAMNPQIAFGEDVVSRISFTNRNSESELIPGNIQLQQRLINTLNGMIEELCTSVGQVQQDQIMEAVVVGNTAMHHLFAGFPVKQLGESPYVPSVSNEVCIKARDLGIAISPGASTYLPPNIAGYVGADHVAMLLATIYNPMHHFLKNKKTVLALDIGTNTEISLLHDNNMVCCSCASGPAFEGAHIHFGMRAAPGAIERVQICENTVRYKTIDDKPPIGICGSGILDTIAEMRKWGILDTRGTIQCGHPHVESLNKANVFVLAHEDKSGLAEQIFITRKDINEIQLAKGAIRAGIEILLSEFGIIANQIDDFIVAGAFGTYIVIENAIKTGMFPDIPIGKFRQVGNAAGAGARQMLISGKRRLLTQEIIQRLKYIELSNHADFTNQFSKALYFPEI